MSNGARIVILGGGFGGAYCAQRLERLLGREEASIVLLNSSNYFIFSPLLIEAGTGSVEPRHAVVSLRSFVRRTDFRMGSFQSWDREKHTVRYQLAGLRVEEELPFDHLVVALGSVTRMPDIPGLADHAFLVKGIGDAVALRDRAIQMLELANSISDRDLRRGLLHFVVVGGSFTGVEVAGEFDYFLRRATDFYPNVDKKDCRVTLVELSDRILPALDQELAGYAARQMRRRGIQLRLRESVSRVDAEGADLTSGERLVARTVIWCAGIAPPPASSRMGLPVDERGYLLTESNLRVKGEENVWAIGDCAVNPSPEGDPYPATAQHAVREGRILAENLARVLRGDEPVPCRIFTQGTLAALGCRTGVAKVLGFKLSGFAAWFLWRTVYLMKMPTWGRRLRVALDWSIDFFFSRDFVELGIHRREAGNTMDAGHRGISSRQSPRPEDDR